MSKKITSGQEPTYMCILEREMEMTDDNWGKNGKILGFYRQICAQHVREKKWKGGGSYYANQ